MENNEVVWGEFEFKKVFFFKRGKRLTKLDQTDGEIAYISSSKNNNGIDNYIDPPNYMTIYHNAMTINNSGSVGYCFYHPYEFVCSDHCTVIKIKDESVKFNNYLALFLKPIIEAMKIKYNFAREISDSRLAKENILLPLNSNLQPDWCYMENYIKNISKKIVFNKQVPSTELSGELLSRIDVSTWKEFELKKVFNRSISRGMRLIKTDRLEGSTLYFSASDYNNGLTDLISNPLFVSQDALIYTTFGKCYYIEGEFTASDEVSIFKHDKLNIYNGLFISTIINQNREKYFFGRKAFYNKFSKDTISLPVTPNEEIDWEFMEDFIKSLPYSKSI